MFATGLDDGDRVGELGNTVEGAAEPGDCGEGGADACVGFDDGINEGAPLAGIGTGE